MFTLVVWYPDQYNNILKLQSHTLTGSVNQTDNIYTAMLLLMLH